MSDEAKWTERQFRRMFPNATEDAIRRNVGQTMRPSVDTLGAKEQQPTPRPALVPHVERGPRSKGSLGVVVTIIAVRNTPCDKDNSRVAYKPLQDAIAASLAIDDGSERIRFDYDQAVSAGPEGTIVKIQWL